MGPMGPWAHMGPYWPIWAPVGPGPCRVTGKVYEQKEVLDEKLVKQMQQTHAQGRMMGKIDYKNNDKI